MSETESRTHSLRPWWVPALIAISVWGSALAPAAAQEAPRHAAASSATAASAAASSASAPTRPGPAASAGTADLEQLGQRIDKLAAAVSAVSAVASAASAAQPNDSWQDVKSVMLNVLSNRIDAFLFGGGGGGAVSAGAKLLALLALVYAGLKLLLAFFLLYRGPPGGRLDALRERMCRNRGLAVLRCGLAILALAYTGVAYYLVAGAASASDASSAASLEALRGSLQSCQAQLQARPQVQSTTGPAAGAASAELMAAVERQGQACVNALRTQSATLSRLQEQVQAVEAAQPSGLSKMLTFLAWACALGALGFLLSRALR